MDDRRIWSLRIKEARSREELREIADVLQALPGAWAGACRIEAVKRIMMLRRGAIDRAASGTAFAAAYGLEAPDGRWLHRYRLSDDGFRSLEADLVGGTFSRLSAGHQPGLFVLWAAEWFRRHYKGGGHRWADLAEALRITEDQEQFRKLTAAGLRLWDRSVMSSASSREFLGSLAREGGFPVAAVQEGGRGWAQDLLKAIVAPLLAEPSAGIERARELAELQQDRLPQLFRDADFIALCADMGLAVVELRREADAAAAQAGVPVVVWLELNRPGWREQLPVVAGDRAAEALIDGLMKVEVAYGAAVGVERFLRRDAGAWHEAVRLSLDGALDSAATRALDPTIGRLRAFTAGEMARSIPGEIAMLEAPADGDTGWTARSTRRAQGILPLPFATAVELDLRSGEQRVGRIALAGGKPRRGALIVATAADGTEEGPGDLLKVVGSGSGRYRAERLILQVPAAWRVDTTLGETVTLLGRGVGATQLWQVTGGAFVTDESNDRFRILCGQAQDMPSRIELFGEKVGWAETAGDIDMYCGPPQARISGEGGLFIRPIGAPKWIAAPRPLPVGHYDISWRRDGITLDRRRIAVLPAAAALQRGGSIQRPEYRPTGFAPCHIMPDDQAPVMVDGAGQWRGRPSAAVVHWFTAQIMWPDAPSLSVRIAYPSPASIARWSGEILPNQARITLDDLRDLVAVNDGRVQMVGELLNRGRRLADMTWEVVDELPMASVAIDLASLLLPVSIDAEVRIGMHDGIETWWRLRQFPHELIRTGEGMSARPAVVDEAVTVVGRSLAWPAEERHFGAYSLLSDTNHRPVMLPPLAGDWLIYLRRGAAILSRPHFHRGENAAEPTGPLAVAMAEPPGVPLDRALGALLDAAESDSDNAARLLADLCDLAASLNGLPPLTFRALDLLAGRQALLARMALTAGPDARKAVMDLSDALPFAWCTIGRQHWDDARRNAFEQLLGQFAPLGDKAAHYAMEAIDTVLAGILAEEPLLAAVLKPSPAEPLVQIAQAFMNRAVDRIPRGHGDRYRAHIADHLPAYFHRFDSGCLDTLDAPCAAAAAVVGHWVPDADDVRHIKTVARNFPTFFADAFAAALQEFD